MHFLNIVILVTIFVKRHSVSSMDHHCFESPGNPGVRVGMFFKPSLPFVPKKVFLEYKMLGSTWKQEEAIVKGIDFKRFKTNCEKHGIWVPKVDKSGENVWVDITIYSDDTKRVEIEHFKMEVAHNFESKIARITGLNDLVSINVNFAPYITKLKFARSPSFKYSQISGIIKGEGRFCLKLFKPGKEIILWVTGSKISNMDIYDRYFVEASLPNTGSGEVRKIFFAHGYKCANDDEIRKWLIYVDDFPDEQTPVPEVKLSITDYSGQQIWENVIAANKDEHADLIRKDNVDIWPVKVLARKIERVLRDKDGLMMYPLTAERHLCKEDSDQSFVEYRMFGSAIVETRSQFVSRDYSTDKYKVMHSGTQEQIDKCIKKK